VPVKSFVPPPDGPPPNQITVTPLDDHSLDVRWTAPVDQSVNGFVVEWSVVTSDGGGVLHWERLRASQEELVITGQTVSTDFSVFI